MNTRKHVEICLEPYLLRGARSGNHNFLGKVISVLEKGGFQVDLRGDELIDRVQSQTRDGYTLFNMVEPDRAETLCMRPVYHLPFWAIETTNKRWNWRVAKAKFDPDTIKKDQADKFFGYWRDRLFGDAAITATQDGFIYAPLQGRLDVRRSFQTCSPFEMLVETLNRVPGRRVIATLHPKETYSQAELQKLDTLVARFPRLELRADPMEDMLRRCDFVVTQNSGVAFNGYFFGKNCVLFGQTDFHHISGDVFTYGRHEAFDVVRGPKPDFAKYIWWFWQDMSINAGRDNAENRIRQALRRGGWPI